MYHLRYFSKLLDYLISHQTTKVFNPNKKKKKTHIGISGGTCSTLNGFSELVNKEENFIEEANLDVAITEIIPSTNSKIILPVTSMLPLCSRETDPLHFT